MEILRRGKNPEEKSAEFSCRNCKTELRANRSEGQDYFHQKDGNSCIFKCPVCDKEIWVALSQFN
jgi:hypothetical protein